MPSSVLRRTITRFSCECDKSFRTVRGLALHKSRYCSLRRIHHISAREITLQSHAAAPNDATTSSSSQPINTHSPTSPRLLPGHERDDGTSSNPLSGYERDDATIDPSQCPICERRFKGVAGVRQHMRLAHIIEYNRDLEAHSTNARLQWSRLEIGNLAKAEADYLPKTGLLDYLANLWSQRTREAIKGRRKRSSYKRQVAEIRQQIAQDRNPRLAKTQTTNRAHILTIPSTTRCHHKIQKKASRLMTLLTARWPHPSYPKAHQGHCQHPQHPP